MHNNGRPKNSKFTPEIISYIENNLSKGPTELMSNIRKKFNTSINFKAMANKKDYIKKRLGKSKIKDENIVIDTPISNKSLSSDDIIRKAGRDPSEWIIKQTWTGDKSNKIHLVKKPLDKLEKEDWGDIFKNEPPIKLPPYSRNKGGFNYLINIADIHFGITTFDDVKDVLIHIKNYFKEQDSLGNINRIYLNLLGDEFHSAITGKSVTNSMTPLNKAFTRRALKDARKFFHTIFDMLVPLCTKFDVYNVYGNHDGGNSFTFLDGLSDRYQDINFHLNYSDVLQEYNNYYLVDNIGIMVTHGDMGKNRLDAAFIKKGSEVFCKSKNRIILTGHYHKEKTTELDNGVKIYQIGTNKAQDNWSNKNLFLLSNTERNWNIFKLNENEIQGIEYI